MAIIETPSDIFKMGLSMLVTSVFVFGISTTASGMNQLSAAQQENQAVATHMREISKHQFFDNTIVYQQDIVASILTHKGDLEIFVRVKDGTVYEWSRDTKSTEYKASSIDAVLPGEDKYRSTLIKGPAGNVVGYEFTAIGG